MQELEWVRQLSDEALIVNLDRSVQDDRRVTVRVLAHLSEVDARGLFRDLGYCSMFDYALRKLHMSDSEAALRIRVARLGRKFPVALEMLARGELHLTALNVLAPVLTQDSLALLQQARFQSKQRVLELRAQHAPQPDVPSSIRRLPERKPARAPSLAGTDSKAAAPMAHVAANTSTAGWGTSAHSAAGRAPTPPSSAEAETAPSLSPVSDAGATTQAVLHAVAHSYSASETASSLFPVSHADAPTHAVPRGMVHSACATAPSLSTVSDPEISTHAVPRGMVHSASATAPSLSTVSDPETSTHAVPRDSDKSAAPRVPAAADSVETSQTRLTAADDGSASVDVRSEMTVRARSAFAWVSGAAAEDIAVNRSSRSEAVGGGEANFRLSMPSSSSAVVPLSPARYKVTFTVSQRVRNKLEEAQALLRHQLPSRDFEPLFERALDALISEHKKQRFAQTRNPRRVAPVRRSKPNSRHIASDVRRRVWARDGGRCCFRGPDGTRCNARSFLEFHHIEPFARGGASTVDNLTIYCHVHNALVAERDYGREYIENRRARATNASQRADSPRSLDLDANPRCSHELTLHVQEELKTLPAPRAAQLAHQRPMNEHATRGVRDTA